MNEAADQQPQAIRQYLTRSELLLLADPELRDEMDKLLATVAEINGKIEAEMLMFDRGAKEINQQWLSKASIAASRMKDTARWISDRLEIREKARSLKMRHAEISVEIATQKRITAEAQLKLHEQAVSAKAAKNEISKKQNENFERLFISSAKEKLPESMFYLILAAAKEKEEQILRSSEVTTTTETRTT